MSTPGTFVAGDVLNAAEMNALPAGVLGYAQATSAQGSITTITDLTSLTTTVTVPASRRIRVTGWVNFASSADTDDNHVTILTIRESSTTLQSALGRNWQSGNGITLVAFVVLTPSTGAHTYKLSLSSTDNATGTAAAAGAPAAILVEDIGAA